MPIDPRSILDPQSITDQQDIDFKRQMAQALIQRSLTPTQGHMAGNVYVAPSWTQGLASMLGVLQGKQMQGEAGQGQRQLQQQGAQDVGKLVDALRGTPAKQDNMAAIDPSMAQYGNYESQAAKPGDPSEALRIALASQNPMLQQAGGGLLNNVIAQSVPKVDKWGTDPRYDQQGNAYLVSEQGNVKMLPGVKARDKIEVSNGKAYNPFTTAPGTTFEAQPNPYTDVATRDPVTGNVIPNQPVITAKKEIQKAGAPSTNVKIENQLGGSLATQVGPMIAASHTAALGAQGAIINADNITKALDSGKVNTGPGATLRLRGAQFADMLGIGGTDNAEKITKTREVIQGLAQSTLSARKQLAGQGQVSDNEGKLLERAASGNIDDMTTNEIRTVVGVNKRLAQRQIQVHNQLIEKTRGNAATAPIANFFELPPMEQTKPQVMKFDAQGNPVQ